MMALTGTIPSRLLLQSSRLDIANGQRRLAEAQAEASSGRHSDVGLALGTRTGIAVSLHSQLASIDQSSAALTLSSLNVETVQDALSRMSTIADRFRSTLVGARSAEGGRELTAVSARSALDAMYEALSVTQNGGYLFSGLSSDTPPLIPYESGPRQALIDAFQSAFGFQPDDPAAAALTPTQVSEFLDGSFQSLFSGSGWSETWSAVTGERTLIRLPEGGSVEISPTVNERFAQGLTGVFAMMDLLGHSKINAMALAAASEKALTALSEGQIRIGDEQAVIGISASRLKDAAEHLGSRKANLSAMISAMESVDPYEAATRVNVLMTQLEGSYALTNRISKMSLLSYL